jgi:hypothetical protein
MSQGKEEPDSNWPLALLHQFARYIVDAADVVGIDRMPQPKTVRDERCRQQQRVAVKRRDGLSPGEQVRENQDDAEPDHFRTNMVGSVIEDGGWRES